MVFIPKGSIHRAISKKRTGFNFKELHDWIDKNDKNKGINHRLKKHAYNTKEEKEIRDYWDKKKGKGWGNKAVVEWLFHIALDNLETAFKIAKKAYRGNNAYNFFEFGLATNGYVYADFSRESDDDLQEIFVEIEKYIMENGGYPDCVD